MIVSDSCLYQLTVLLPPEIKIVEVKDGDDIRRMNDEKIVVVEGDTVPAGEGFLVAIIIQHVTHTFEFKDLATASKALAV